MVRSHLHCGPPPIANRSSDDSLVQMQTNHYSDQLVLGTVVSFNTSCHHLEVVNEKPAAPCPTQLIDRSSRTVDHRSLSVSHLCTPSPLPKSFANPFIKSKHATQTIASPSTQDQEDLKWWSLFNPWIFAQLQYENEILKTLEQIQRYIFTRRNSDGIMSYYVCYRLKAIHLSIFSSYGMKPPITRDQAFGAIDHVIERILLYEPEEIHSVEIFNQFWCSYMALLLQFDDRNEARMD